MAKPWINENWFSSPHTYHPDVQSGFNTPEKVEFLDLTLDEDGEGMAGAYLTEDQKIIVAEKLDELGVSRIGVLGYPSPITDVGHAFVKEQVKTTKKIAGRIKQAKLTAFVNTIEDIDLAIDAGVWGVVIRKPISHLNDIEPEPKDAKIENVVKLGEYARRNGLHITLMAQEITRVELEGEPKEIICSIHDQLHLDEICLADSHGVGTPFGYRYLVRTIRDWLNIPVQVHCHNHLGLGVANSCASVVGGAQIVHTTMHGLGHLAGMPPLEEVIIALQVGFGIRLGFKTEMLYEISQSIQSYNGIRLPPHKPVVGDRAFVLSEDVLYIQQLFDKDRLGIPRLNYLPYLPELVGNRYRVVMGSRVSTEAVQWNLEHVGLQADEHQLQEIVDQVKGMADRVARLITDDEFDTIVKEVLGL